MRLMAACVVPERRASRRWLNPSCSRVDRMSCAGLLMSEMISSCATSPRRDLPTWRGVCALRSCGAPDPHSPGGRGFVDRGLCSSSEHWLAHAWRRGAGKRWPVVRPGVEAPSRHTYGGNPRECGPRRLRRLSHARARHRRVAFCAARVGGCRRGRLGPRRRRPRADCCEYQLSFAPGRRSGRL